jgi:hypothetical protein
MIAPLDGAAFAAASAIPYGKLRGNVRGGIIWSMITTRIRVAVLGSLLILGGVAAAQRPVRNVSGGRHPNLAAAQRLSRQAWQRVVDAQKANEWDMGGHAQKAKDLLDQANNELKEAAQAANRNHK